MTRKLEGRLGLFPGTFDPIHLGHVEIARIAKKRLNLNAVIFVPNYIPPHKELLNHASVFDRLCMVQLAILDIEKFYVSDFEVLQGGVSYTIHTLRYFKAAYPTCELRLIIGGDNLLELHTWREIDEYAGLVDIVGISRAGETIEPEKLKIPDELKITLEVIEEINLAQSSSDIKSRIVENKDLSGLVNPLVARYIKKYELYQSAGVYKQ